MNHSGKTNLDLLEQEIMSGSGISCTICKSAPHSRQITMPAPHHWVFYRPNALPATQPTASKHWRSAWRSAWRYEDVKGNANVETEWFGVLRVTQGHQQ